MLQERVGRGTERVVTAARLPKWLVRIALVVAIGVLALQPLIANAAQPPVGLGTAASFAVLAGQGVTNTGPTVVNGDLGTSPNPAVTGFPPGKVHGQIHKADAVALQAQKDLTTAYNDAAGRTPVTTIATELGGKTLKPGVYKSASGTFQITGTLTLDAQGDSNAVFIFQMAATLVTASSSKVSLLGGASACSVFWQVGSSATLGTNSTFTGNILALTSIQVQTGVTVDGRALARNASVTLDNDTFKRSTCAAPTTPSSTTPSPTTSPATPIPTGGVATGGGSTAGVQDLAVLAVGVALLVGAGAAFGVRRRVMRKGSSS
jgi:Ice-binding-like